MPRYDYTAAEANGRPVKGTRDVVDPHQLAAILSAEGLFLVSCHVATARAPAAPPPAATPLPTERLLTDADKLSPMARRIERLRAFFITPKGLAFLGSLLALCMMGDYVYLSHMKNNPFRTMAPPSMTDEEHVIAEINPGQQRGDIERRLTTRAEGSTPAQTSYVLNATTRIHVSYDATGGLWSAQNRVLRRPYIQRMITH